MEEKDKPLPERFNLIKKKIKESSRFRCFYLENELDRAIYNGSVFIVQLFGEYCWRPAIKQHPSKDAVTNRNHEKKVPIRLKIYKNWTEDD